MSQANSQSRQQSPQAPLRPKSLKLNLKRNENLWISLIALTCPYLVILLIVIGAERSDHWLGRLLALPLIAALQNHLQILLHEGAHFQLHPKRKWNDLLTDLFCAVPFFGLVRHYRYFHFAHHRHVLDPAKDPEIGFYSEQGYFFQGKSTAALLKMLILDLCGYHYFQFFLSYNGYLFKETRAKRMPGMTLHDLFLLSATLAGCLVLIFHKQGFYLLMFYWVLPQATFMFFFLKLQGYGEHTERASKLEECTLTHDLGFMTRFFIYPLNSDLHLEHHLYPSVPWYRLRRIANHCNYSAQKRHDGYFWGKRSILRKLLLSNP